MARVLVVDDENNIRLMVRIALQAAGHEVQTASDGAEALALYGDGGGWDLVLLDQRMPGMEGLQVLQEMRRRQPEARVVMITAFGTIDLAASAMKAGATDFLRKPFTTSMLRGAAQAALDGAPAAATRPCAGPDAPLSGASINGFRILAGNGPGAGSAVVGSAGEVRHSFQVRGQGSEPQNCDVLLPEFFVELVKAHADRETIPDAGHFWPWLCEEALANYLWQNAELPPGGLLQVEELTSGLRHWVDAVLA